VDVPPRFSFLFLDLRLMARESNVAATTEAEEKEKVTIH
jgi:hypothetical protein